MTVEPMTDADVDWIKSRLNPSAYFQWTSIDAHAVRRLFARLDAERARADAAEAERDAALARRTERC